MCLLIISAHVLKHERFEKKPEKHDFTTASAQFWTQTRKCGVFGLSLEAGLGRARGRSAGQTSGK